MTFSALALSLVLQTPINATLDPNEVEYQQLLSTLALNQTLVLQLTGNIYYHGKTTPITSTLSWSSGTVSNGSNGTKIQLQAEIEDEVNGILVRRIVADGNTVWSYDLNLHEYSAISYGGYGATRPGSYQSVLLSDLNAVATGSTAYLTKLLRQIFTTQYTSWMPGVVSVSEGIGPFADPVNPYMSYSQPPAGQIIDFYLYNGNPKRSVVFQVTPGNGTTIQDALSAVYFNQMDQLGRYQRLTSWEITLPAPSFTASLFQPFSASQTAGWKPVVAPKPTTTTFN